MTPEEQRKAALAEIPPHWVNRDYDEEAPPKPRRWLTYCAIVLSVIGMSLAVWNMLAQTGK